MLEPPRNIAALAAVGSWNGFRPQGRAPSVRLSWTRAAPFHVKPVGINAHLRP